MALWAIICTYLRKYYKISSMLAKTFGFCITKVYTSTYTCMWLAHHFDNAKVMLYRSHPMILCRLLTNNITIVKR